MAQSASAESGASVMRVYSAPSRVNETERKPSKGFMEAEKLLQEERIFVDDDVPYSTQLIPLSAICAVLIQNNKMFITSTKEKIKQWYWCGVFGELYGGAK